MDNNSALLVIDMQNVYLPQNNWGCLKMDDVIKYIEEKIKDFPENQVFFTKHIAFEKPMGQWKMYNENYADINSDEYLNDYILELKKYLTNDNLFIKNTFSALSNKNLLETLDKFDTIYVTGVIAECCVLSTVFSLIDMGKKIIYCTNGIASQSEQKAKAVVEVLEDLSPLHVVFKY